MREVDRALLGAAALGRTRRASLLLKSGADPNIVGDNNHNTFEGMEHLSIRRLGIHNSLIETFTPLKLAVMRSEFRMAKLLLRSGADPNWVDHRGWTALHIACGDSLWIVRLLLRSGADANARTGAGGLSPLDVCHRVRIAKVLVAAGADVNANVYGRTPLHDAAEDGNCRMIKFLLRVGADPCAAIGTGEIPLNLAAARNHRRATRILRRYERKDMSP